MHACVEAFTGRRENSYIMEETPHTPLGTWKLSSLEVGLEMAFWGVSAL